MNTAQRNTIAYFYFLGLIYRKLKYQPSKVKPTTVEIRKKREKVYKTILSCALLADFSYIKAKAFSKFVMEDCFSEHYSYFNNLSKEEKHAIAYNCLSCALKNSTNIKTRHCLRKTIVVEACLIGFGYEISLEFADLLAEDVFAEVAT